MILYIAIVENTYDDEDYLKSEIYLTYKEFEVIRQTECFLVKKINGKERKIGKFSKNMFATFTKQKALRDAMFRNFRHISILNSRLMYAKKVKEFIKEQSCK